MLQLGLGTGCLHTLPKKSASAHRDFRRHGGEEPTREIGNFLGAGNLPQWCPSAPPSPDGTKTALPSTGTHGQAAAEAMLLLAVDGRGVPINTACHGFAQNTGQVLSGSGDLGGATVRLGPVSISGKYEFSMLQGEYSVHVSCSADSDKGEGAGSLNCSENVPSYN